MADDFYVDDLKTMNWLGEVMDNVDTEKLGRLKVKVFGKFDLLETENIPWAYPSNHITGGSATGSGFFSVPKIGSIVNVYFDNGDIYCPIYTYLQKPSDELITEIGDDTQMFHSLIYDTEIENGFKIFYSANAEKGLIINLKNTIINIRNDNEIKITNPNGDLISVKNDGTMVITTSTNLTVNTKETTINTDDKITVNTKEAIVNADTHVEVNTQTADIKADHINLGDGASEALIKGNAFMSYFNSHVHTGNLGAPTSPAVSPMTPSLLSQISKTK